MVTSNKMEKSIVVAQKLQSKTPLYGKFVLKTKNMCSRRNKRSNIGDTVRIMETRPLSKSNVGD